MNWQSVDAGLPTSSMPVIVWLDVGTFQRGWYGRAVDGFGRWYIPGYGEIGKYSHFRVTHWCEVTYPAHRLQDDPGLELGRVHQRRYRAHLAYAFACGFGVATILAQFLLR